MKKQPYYLLKMSLHWVKSSKKAWRPGILGSFLLKMGRRHWSYTGPALLNSWSWMKMMPRKDGFTLAKEIRQLDNDIPIIFLTAKSQPIDVVEGFNVGGNDYLKKPFSMEELIVRVHNLLKRKEQGVQMENISIGPYVFNFTKQTLSFSNEESELLTHREAQLLLHLCKNQNELLDRSLILNKLWGNDDFFSARSMDVFISNFAKS